MASSLILRRYCACIASLVRHCKRFEAENVCSLRKARSFCSVRPSLLLSLWNDFSIHVTQKVASYTFLPWRARSFTQLHSLTPFINQWMGLQLGLTHPSTRSHPISSASEVITPFTGPCTTTTTNASWTIRKLYSFALNCFEYNLWKERHRLWQTGISKCIASSNKCLTSSNKKRWALGVASSNKCHASSNKNNLKKL